MGGGTGSGRQMVSQPEVVVLPDVQVRRRFPRARAFSRETASGPDAARPGQPFRRGVPRVVRRLSTRHSRRHRKISPPLNDVPAHPPPLRRSQSRMSKKITQLGKVMQHLGSASFEDESVGSNLVGVSERYENEVDAILRDAAAKVAAFQESIRAKAEANQTAAACDALRAQYDAKLDALRAQSAAEARRFAEYERDAEAKLAAADARIRAAAETRDAASLAALEKALKDAREAKKEASDAAEAREEARSALEAAERDRASAVAALERDVASAESALATLEASRDAETRRLVKESERRVHAMKREADAARRDADERGAKLDEALRDAVRWRERNAEVRAELEAAREEARSAAASLADRDAALEDGVALEAKCATYRDALATAAAGAEAGLHGSWLMEFVHTSPPTNTSARTNRVPT